MLVPFVVPRGTLPDGEDTTDNVSRPPEKTANVLKLLLVSDPDACKVRKRKENNRASGRILTRVRLIYSY